MKSLFNLSILALILSGCDAQNAGSTLLPAEPAEQATGETVSSGPVSIHTVSQAIEVEAGGSLDVKCHYLDSMGVRVEGPAVGLSTGTTRVESKVTDNVVTLFPEVAGSLHVQCVSLDGLFVDQAGIDLAVSPALPFSMVVETEDSDCLLQNVAIPMVVNVYDVYGNAIERPHLDVQWIPEMGVSGDLETGFRFANEGEFDLTIAVSGPTATGADIEPYVQTLHVDETAPTLEILAPAQGEMLRLGSYDDTEVSVWVSTDDAVSGIDKITIDGVDQDTAVLDGSELIETSQISRWGMSVVSASSEDACGNVTYVAHAYYRSPEYLPAAQAIDEDATISNALVARVSQSFVDDGNRETLDDLASIAQAGALNIDLDTEIPAGTVLAEDPYLADCGGANGDTSYELSRNPSPHADLSMEGPWIHSLNIVDGGIEFQLSVDAIQVPLNVWATASTCVLFDVTWADVETTVDVVIHSVLVDVTFGVSYIDGEPTISLDDFVADFAGTEVDIDCGLLDFACDAITGAARSTIESKVETILQEKVRGEIAPMLEEALATFAPAPSIALPAPLGVELSASARFSQIEFCGAQDNCGDEALRDAGIVGFDAQMIPGERGENVPADVRGPIFRGADLPQFNADADFGVAISDDFINQMFWAAWYSGAMDIDVVEQMGEALPAAVEEASVNVMSPPVVMPGTGATGVMFGLGNVRVSARVDAGALMAGISGTDGEEVPYIPMDIEATISTRIDATLSLAADGSKLVVDFDSQPEAFVQVSRVDNSPLASELGALISGMLPHLIPALLADVATAVEIPALDVGSMVGSEDAAPIGLENGQVRHTSAYILAEGDFNPRL
jgi:hypothetical protein